MTLREHLVMAPLLVLIFWMGLFPNHFLSWSNASVAHLVNNKDNYTLNVAFATDEKIEAAAKTAVKDSRDE